MKQLILTCFFLESKDKEARAIPLFIFITKFMLLSGIKYLFLPFENYTQTKKHENDTI